MLIKFYNTEKQKTYKNGYTVVEIAVAIVIIGFIMILSIKGMDIVYAARTRANVNKILKISRAIETTFALYGYQKFNLTDTNNILFEKYLSKDDMDVFGFYTKLVSCSFYEYNGITYLLPSVNNLYVCLDGYTTLDTVCSVERALDDKSIFSGNGRASKINIVNDPIFSDNPDVTCSSFRHNSKTDTNISSINYAFIVYKGGR